MKFPHVMLHQLKAFLESNTPTNFSDKQVLAFIQQTDKAFQADEKNSQVMFDVLTIRQEALAHAWKFSGEEEPSDADDIRNEGINRYEVHKGLRDFWSI